MLYFERRARHVLPLGTLSGFSSFHGRTGQCPFGCQKDAQMPVCNKLIKFSFKSNICLLHQSKKTKIINAVATSIIINDVLVQRGSGEAMLVKFLNPFDDKLNLFWGHQTGAVQNVHFNKLNSVQYSIIT